MKKKLSVFFIILLMFDFLIVNAATLNEKYYTKLNIGLSTMSSTNLTLKLNGDYDFNGEIIGAGAIINVVLSNNKIVYNDKSCDVLIIKPMNKDNTIYITSNGKSYKYLGEFRFFIDGDKILPINIIEIEEYLKGVVGYEMSNSYPIEALKAQAVAARNYAISNIGKHGSKGFDLCDDTCCQVYKGYNETLKNVIRAVDETKGIVLLYNSSIVSAYYCASNGGFTEASQNVWSTALPYLVTKEDNFDNDYNWTSEFTTAQIDEILRNKKILNQDEKFIRIITDDIKKFESGRIKEIKIVYLDKNSNEQIKSFTKESARTFLSLKSAMYDVVYDSPRDTYVFSGQGYGHGVGMSQIGAKNRANNGHDYQSILSFYYKDTYLKTLITKIKNFIFKDEVLIGQAIVLSSEAFEGTGNYLYKYVVENNGQTVYVRDFSSDKNAIFTPIEIGNYTATVYVKDIKSSNEFDDKKTISFKVSNKPQIKSISVGPENLCVRKDIYINAEISGGSSKGKEIGFEVFKGDKIIASKISNNNIFGFVPYDEGEYIVRVRVKDNASSEAFDDIKEMKFKVVAQPTTSRGDQQPKQEAIRLNITRTLRKGMIGTDVKLLQSALQKLGFYKYSLTVNFNSQTDKAVKDFQRANGLKADGIVGPKTRTKIESKLNGNTSNQQNTKNFTLQGSNKIMISYGMKGEEVKKLQMQLKKKGYFKSSITGIFDKTTQSALKAYQKANKLPQTGVLDTATYNKLYK